MISTLSALRSSAASAIASASARAALKRLSRAASPRARGRAAFVAFLCSINNPLSGAPRGTVLHPTANPNPPASAADLPVPPRDPLQGAELRQAHRTVRVELGGGDPDLGAEAELSAVVEAGRRVHEHARRVDLAQPPLGL